MPRGTFDYMAGGADDEVTLRDNVDAWTRLRLRPRVLRDVSTVATTTTVLGTEVSTPVLVAPVSYLRLVHDDGERAMAAGAAAAGTIMALSTRSSCPIEDVAAAAPGAARWFQVYVLRDRTWTAELVDRAVAAGFGALVLTVDTPVLGYRRRDVLNAFELPEGITMANVASRVSSEVAEAEGLLAAYQAPDLGPADVAWLAERSGLPIVAKGVLTPEAARECVDAGASAVVVSNHGGRQLDGVLATADALAAVVDAVGSDVEVYVDGGVRRGTDILKALAAGARAVLVGRPAVWGLATAGAEGVQSVIGHLSFELAAAMALAGVREPAEADRGMVDLRSHHQ
jgi:4-hydroxymandelate oxidase